MDAEDDVADALSSLGKRPLSGLDRRLLSDLRARLLGRDSLPHTIGRFTVLSEIGRGGMGTVYAVYDPQLDRKVALKSLLEPPREDSDSVLAEAKRLARVRHPYVTAVYEAFVEDDVVYVAMELVEGDTLDAWRAAHDPSPREIVDVLTQAGLGLQAVHDAGLVHRDFKPSNVVVGPDGRAQLLDFGLAVAAESDHASIAGTAGYIAPECLDGAPASHRSDQFAFCVVATEMFAGTAPPKAADVLRRGMDPDPEARYPDMRHVVSQLSAAVAVPGRRRRAILLLSAGAAVTAAAGWSVTEGRDLYRGWRLEGQRAECRAAAQDDMGAVWSDARREGVRRGLLASEAPHAATVVDKTVPLLDTYAEGWVEAHEASCLAPGSEEERERSQWCLESGLVEFDVSVQSFEAGDPGVVDVATEIASALSPATLCTDHELQRSMPAPPPPSQKTAVSGVIRDLFRVRAEQRLGRDDAGLGRAQRVLEAAEETGWPPLVAAAQLSLGQSLVAQQRLLEAKEHLEAAFFGALGSGSKTLAAESALALATHSGVRMNDRSAGLLWLRHADLLIEQEHGPMETTHRAASLSTRAVIVHVDGAVEEAEELYREAAAAFEQAVGDSHPSFAAALNDLGMAQSDLGRWDSAIATLERSAAVARRALGEDHPSLAAVLLNLSISLRRSQRFEQALRVQADALRIDTAALGPTHPSLAPHYANIAGIRGDQGQLEASLEARRKVVEILSGVEESASAELVVARANLAHALNNSGAYDDAREEFATLLPLAAEVFGEDHYNYARLLNNHAKTLSELGETEAAAGAYARSLEILERSGAPPRDTAVISSNYAVKQAELGQVDDALLRVHAAVKALEEATDPGHADVAAAKLKLAAILRIAGRNAEAKDVYRAALTIYDAIPGEQPGEATAREQLETLGGAG